MNWTKLASIGLTAALAAVLPAIPAQAASVTRTFVSASGNDNNNCTITQPCATFARAYTLTLANGIIAALDPGKYGPLTITGPVTVNGYGWAAITGPASGNAITINANSSDKIALIGLEIDGANAANNGIQFNSGGTLSVRNSVIQNFENEGITFAPTGTNATQLLVSNTLVSDMSNNAIHIAPTGSASVAAVLSEIEVASSFNGILCTSGAVINVMVRNSSIINNSEAGLSISGAGTTIRLTRSTITGNSTAWANGPGVISSYGDNNIDGNGANNATPPNPLVYH